MASGILSWHIMDGGCLLDRRCWRSFTPGTTFLPYARHYTPCNYRTSHLTVLYAADILWRPINETFGVARAGGRITWRFLLSQAFFSLCGA